MSRLRRFSLGCSARLLSVAVFALAAPLTSGMAAKADEANPGALFETYLEPGGEAYFSLKLPTPLPRPKAQATDVVVLFDTSASQMGAYRDKGLGALRAMLSELSSADRVELLAVDVNAVRLTESATSPASDDLRRALAALERRVPLGSTDMPQALDAALAAWRARPDPTRARTVVYIGDGFSIAGLMSVKALRRIAGEYVDCRVSFTSYAVGPRVNGELLGALANHTGGIIVADSEQVLHQEAGRRLAAAARGPVVWPNVAHWPAGMRDTFPRQMPPLRFDRDSVLVGTYDPRAIGSNQSLEIEVSAELAGEPVILKWQAAARQPWADNAYLATVVEWARQSDGVGLALVGSEGLNEARRWVTHGAQQFARLGEHALAAGRTDEAAQLAFEAERLDPINAEADVVLDAAVRAFPQAPGDLRMARATAEPQEQIAAVDGDVLSDIERRQRIVQGFLMSEVSTVLEQASAEMNTEPDRAREKLKLLLEKVHRTAELTPEARSQMVSRIESGLRAASRMSEVKTESDLIRQQAASASEARERLHRDLFVQAEKVDQLMSRFNSLMAEERYRDAEAVADIADALAPGTPGFRNAELAARTVGATADINAVFDMRRKGAADMLFGVELSDVPTPDDPPIIYPDPEVWQLITERRKKFKAVDLTDPKPNEAKILSALDETTDLDFSEEPLGDVVDYLKQRHRIEIQLDKKALSDIGVGSEAPITRSLQGISLRAALKLILSELELTYVLHNEVLMITSKAEAENILSSRVYPVADLVVPIPPARNMSGPAGGGMGGGLLGGMGGMGMGGTGMGMGMGGMGMGGMGMGGMNMGMGGMGMGGMGMGGGLGFF